jgi:two-component system sensor histidine kinase BaeS
VTADRPPVGPQRAARTTEPRRVASLRGRLLIAFLAVTVTAIGLVTAAALIGTTQGLSAQEATGRRELTMNAARAAADAYQRAGGWSTADLTATVTIALGGGARLVVRDADGQVVTATTGQGRMNGMNGEGRGQGAGSSPGVSSGPGMGSGAGRGAGAGTPVPAPVTVAGIAVGSVTLLFPTSTQLAGRPIAWTWVVAASLAAIALAVIAAWLITRMLTRPLGVLTATARAFASGDRTARTDLTAPGEVGELAAAFDDAAEQVQVSEQVRRQLSADVAHELRTPLAALQAGLEELRDGLAPADAATLARLHDQSLRLGRVVADLALLSAADAAQLTLRPAPVDLSTIAREAGDAYEPRLRAAGLTLLRDLDDRTTVWGDAERLHQVVGNLLQNCARHCRSGDTVTLTVARMPGGGTVRLTVRDTGPGISAAALPKVFARFWRAGDGSGTGLGLPIARSIVEAHHGTIHVESDGRSGTCVTVDLPADRAVAAAVAGQSRPAP